MQKQWGLYLGSLLFFLVVLGLILVAGPDSYPQSASRGGTARSIPRNTFVENHLISLGVSIVVVAIAVGIAGRGFGSRMKPAVRAYWTERPAEYRYRCRALVLNTATVGTIGFGLIILVGSAFPTMPAELLGVILVVAVLVTVARGALPVARPPISNVSAAEPSGSSDRSASLGS